MNTLAAILRRLRAMPDETLIKKMSNIVPAPRPVTMANGKVIQPRNRIADILKSGPAKRRSARKGFLDDPLPSHYGVDHDYEALNFRVRDFIEEDEVKYQQSRKVMDILKKLKQKGVQGIPPRSRR